MSQPITYTVLAADGQHYGPYPADNVQSWINEGRILADQQMLRSDLTDWFRAGDFSEFNWTTAPAPVAAPTASAHSARPLANALSQQPTGKITLDQIDPMSLAGIRDAANWFFWIAGLSAVNFALELSGTNFGFAVGSLAVDVCAALARQDGQFNIFFVLAGIVIIGIWILLGVFARRAHRTAFIIGMALFALDTLLLLMVFSIIGVAIHAWILYKIFDGLRDAWILKKALRG